MAQTVADTPEAVPPPGPIAQPDFDIVARRGLPLVALAFALLIAGILSDRLWPSRRGSTSR